MMPFSYRTFIYGVQLSSLITMALCIYSLRYRDKRVAQYFAGLTLAMTFYSLASVISAYSPNFEVADLWMNRLRYIGVDLVPIFFLLFVLAYESRFNFLRLSWLIPLLAFPVYDIYMIISPRYHHFFINHATFAWVEGLIMRTGWEPGVWYWVHTFYCYSLLSVALGVLVWSAFKSSAPYRQQAVLLLIGSLLPLAGNFVVTGRLMHHQAVDLTSFGFSYTGLIFAFALFRFRLLDLVPVARDRVLECIDDAVLVLDLRCRVVDINPAGEAMIGRGKQEVVGMAAEECLQVPYSFFELLRDQDNCQVEIERSLPDNPDAIFELRVSRLRLRGGEWVGILIVGRDVSERVAMVDDRESMIRELEAVQAELTRQVKYDFLTRVYSRQYFIGVAAQEQSRALRYQRPLSLIMIDIDNFKQVNDTFGHEAGDRVLVDVARTIKEELRVVDILARFGGEEFVVMLPETGLLQARQVAEKIRAKVAAMAISGEKDGKDIRITVSLGLTSLSGRVKGLDDLLRLADQAMYAAKADGRNCLREKVPA